MHISDLFDPELLSSHIGAGNVAATKHPTSDLTIYNYTPQVQYSKQWDEVTRACRGLIVRGNGEVVARPFQKFFNYAETDMYEETITPSTHVYAFDKLDGSLGIVYWDDEGQPQVATRGSFTSVQAIHASEKIKDILVPNFDNITMLVEIIYPENQIVLDYKGMDDLVLLGGIRIDSGYFMDPVTLFAEIRGVYPEGGFNYLAQNYQEIESVEDALNNLNRTNREGFVLHTDQGTMVKVKQDDYLAMHKAVFNFTKRNVWATYAKQILVEAGVDASEHRYLKNHVDTINGAMDRMDLIKFMKESLPEVVGRSGRKYLTNLEDDYMATLDMVADVVTELNSQTFDSRGAVFKAVAENIDNYQGVITDMVVANADGDHEAIERGIQKIAMDSIYNFMPKKGDKLTEALNEEDE